MTYQLNALQVVLFLAASTLCLCTVLVFFFMPRAWREKHHWTFEKRIGFSILFLVGATWIMRFMVGISGVFADSSLNGFEEFFNSLIHTLQTFSMDEDYTDYILKGKDLVNAVLGSGGWYYAALVSLLNVGCVAAGGAILFTIVLNFFPNIKLWFMRADVRRPICYFSELNDQSLALARSIRASEEEKLKQYKRERKSGGKSEKLKKPHPAILVFSDVYADTDNERTSERIQEAKFLGAVCLKNDLSSQHLSKRPGKKFFLMDVEETANLQTLCALFSKEKLESLNESLKSRRNEPEKKPENGEKPPRDEYYLFYRTEGSELILDHIDGELSKAYGKKEPLCKEKPLIISVNEYQRLACNLMMDKPLYAALDAGEQDGKLQVTIFGAGAIGTELFLAVYWCGQMLHHALHITVVAKEKEEEFYAKINNINPDILKTAEEGNELLRIYPGERSDCAAPYFKLEYVQADLQKNDLMKKLVAEGKNGRIVDSDYFMVALGSDKENLEMAEKLGRNVTIHRADQKKKPAPVAFVLYDDALRKSVSYARSGSEMSGVDFYPFASLDETFDIRRIVFENIQDDAQKINDTYRAAVADKMSKKYEKLASDPYSAWADIARAIHLQYKAFCTVPPADDTKEENISPVDRYKEMVKQDNSPLRTSHKIAWLEHRRWNAFMRAQGFRKPEGEKEEKVYLDKLPEGVDNGGKHKNIRLKLHPCLVECEFYDEKRNLYSLDKNEWDMLDEVSMHFLKDYQEKFLREKFSVTIDEVSENKRAEILKEFPDALTDSDKRKTQKYTAMFDELSDAYQEKAVTEYDFKRYDYAEHDPI